MKNKMFQILLCILLILGCNQHESPMERGMELRMQIESAVHEHDVDKVVAGLRDVQAYIKTSQMEELDEFYKAWPDGYKEWLENIQSELKKF